MAGKTNTVMRRLPVQNHVMGKSRVTSNKWDRGLCLKTPAHTHMVLLLTPASLRQLGNFGFNETSPVFPD